MLSGGTEFQINSQGQLNQSMPTIGSDGAGKYITVWVNTMKADHSILSAQRYLVPNGDVGEGIVDVTAGEVRVVNAEQVKRRTNPQAAQRPVATQAVSNTGQDSTVTMNIATATPVPVVATVAPTVSVPQLAENVVTPPAAIAPSPAQKAAATNPSTSARVNQAAAVALQNTARARTQARPARLNMRNPSGNSASINASRNIMLQRAQQSRQPQQPRYGNTQLATARGGMLGRNHQSSSTSSRAAWSLRGTSTRTYQPPNRTSLRVSQGAMRSAPQVGRTSSSRNAQSSAANQRFTAIRQNAQASAQLARSTGNRAVPASVVKNGRGSQLTWISQAGARYQVQTSTDKARWNNVGNARSGQRTGFDSMSVNNGGHKFLRVVRTN
jgi:hypothetical protein